MKRVKRLTAVILSALMMTSAFSALPVSAATIESDTSVVSADETFKSGDYEYSLLNGGTVNITKYIGSDSDVTIPAVIDGKKVTSIGNNAFYGCSSLSSINIPDSVTSIGYRTFYGCSSLTSINIPDSVTSIDWDAFSNCTSLTSVNIPNSVTSIGYSAFDGCSSLTSISIPDGVTSIGNWTFGGCSNLTSINIPDSVTSIGVAAFRDCTSLTSITIPDSVTSIGYSAFEGCSSLTSINIPDSVTSIGGGAFNGCRNLTSISIPDGVTSIGNSAFEGCTSLTSISIPDGVTNIGWYAFYRCSSLSSINIPNGVTSIGDGAFSYCESLSSINIPDGVTSIGYDAFSYCESLTGINIPDGVTKIGDRAFYDCSSLTSINIPNSVTSIGNEAFSYCYNLSDVFYSNSDTEWSNISNDNLASANIHYNTSSDDYFEASRTEADCTTDGVIEYKCPHGYTKTEKIPAYGHNLINGICSRCGKNELECFESAHPYEDNCDKSWTINKPGAKSVSITFSSQTEVEDGYDYIEIYDGKDNLIGSYTGTALASQCITVTGDTVRIRLTSDSSNSYYGFSIDSIDYEVNVPTYRDFNDIDTDISVTANADAQLVVSDVTAEQTETLDTLLQAHEQVASIYDISLQKDGVEVQPNGDATVKIPVSNANSKVYRVETNKTLTDMNASYSDGYMVFTTSHFSVYIVAEPNALSLGDVNGDGEINILDATCIQKYIVQLEDFTDKQKEVADVNGDGTINIMDSTQIQKYIVQLIDTLG